MKTEKITLPEGFSAGYARVDCTPDEPMHIHGVVACTTHDPLMITCTALSDGEKVALMMSADLKGIARGAAKEAIRLIEEEYGISEEYVMISATHSHSAPTLGGSSEAMVRWISKFCDQIRVVVGKAIADLAPAKAFAGVSHTDGINFVRRYLLADGSYKTNPREVDVPVSHETEADSELRTIRFQRENAKDIVLMNFQTHYGLYEKAYSADFIHYLRQMSEGEMDVHFGYYSGASGNLNMSDRVGPSPDKMNSVKKMWETAKVAMSQEEPVQLGKVRGATGLYPAKVLKDSAERVAQAKEIESKTDEEEKKALRKKYGFGSFRWVRSVLTRAGLEEIQKIPFTAISFGDLAFTSSPIEQFDANAKWVRDNSPFKMTFSLSLTNGSFGYVPTAEAFPHGGYEVAVCRYVPGSGEEFAREQLRLLNECYNQR